VSFVGNPRACVTNPLDQAGEHLLRELAPQVLGAVVRRYRDFPAAEDAVQEALLAASQQWPAAGIPANPRGWLIQVAVRRMADHVRREAARRRREAYVISIAPPDLQDAIAIADSLAPDDDTLGLLFMCGHPALTRSSATALMLRAVGGLTTAEIARAFLVPEATMAQRISRAKKQIKESGERFELPDAAARAARLASVLHVPQISRTLRRQVHLPRTIGVHDEHRRVPVARAHEHQLLPVW
jgi:RNA polymerase sigma factor (sigma-70 family)